MKIHRPGAGLVLAVIAIVLTLGGTATAAKLITGKQVKNSSLTGADVKNASLTGRDVKNGSIGPSDLSSAARKAVSGSAGSIGPKGGTGAAGAAGAPGAKGDTGAQGGPGAKGDTGAAGADTGTALSGRILNLPQDATLRFAYPSGLGTAFTTQADREMLSPAVATKASDLSVRLTAAVGVGGDRFFAVRVNGSVSSQLVCSITTDFATSCTSEGSFDVPPSSRLTIVSSPTGTPQATDALFSLRLSKG